MIFCTRAKQAYVEVEKNGRKTYDKVGMELQQRDGWEFDFDFALIMDMENNANVSKGMGYVPTGLYIKKPDEKTIELIIKSITENTENIPAVPAESKATASKKQEEVVADLQAKVIAECKRLDAKSHKNIMDLLETYEPTKNPSKMKDQAKLTELLGKLIEIQIEGA